MWNSATMDELHKHFSSFLMNPINNSFPSFHLFFIIQSSCPNESSSSQTPTGSLCEYESSSSSLLIILLHDGIGDAEFGIASLSGECGHDDSVVESEVSHLNFVVPVDIHALGWLFYVYNGRKADFFELLVWSHNECFLRLRGNLCFVGIFGF